MTSSLVRSRLMRWVCCLLLGIVSFGCGDPKLSSSTKSDGGETGDSPAGVRLLFVSLPTREVAGTAFATPVQVALFKGDGKIDTTWTGTVRLSLGVNGTVAELEGPLSATAVAGVATFDGLRIMHAATGYTIRAATDGYETVESLGFTVTPAPATTAVFLSQPSSRVAGQVFDPPLEIELRHAFNNPVTNLKTPLILHLQVDGETPPDALLGTTSVTPVQGRALFADVTPTLAGKGLRLLVSVDANVTATSRRFDVTPDSLAQLVITQQPGNITADDKFDPPIAIVVADQFGNRVPSEPRSISLSLKDPFLGATLSGTTTATTLDGIATFPGVSVWMAGKAYVVEARSGELTSALSNPFDVTPGVAASFRFLSEPSSEVAGVSFDPPIEVAVVDVHGNVVSDSLIPVTVTMRSEGNMVKILTGTKTLDTVAGRVVFTDLAGTEATAINHFNTLSASSPGLTTFRGNNFTISPAAPATLTFVAAPVSGVLGVPVISDPDSGPLDVKVLLQDIYKNNITTPTTVTASLVSPVPGAQLQGTLSVPTSNGTAAFSNLIIDRLGDGYALEFSTAGVSSLRSNTFDVLQLSAVDALSAGPNHTCALKDDLAMYCWGSNTLGQSQPRTLPSTPSSVQVPTLTTERGGWQVLFSAASNVTCGLQPHGALFCRGDNSGGIFGNGRFVSSNKLTQESTKASWTSVAVGGAHACAIRSDGTMSCWGAGAAGQRGDGESGSAVLATSTPAPELSGSSWRAVSAGLTHTCGIKTDGSLWCWGEGGDGQLGTGSTSQSDVAVRESSNATWLSVDCGDNHTCGIQADGSLWCWGRNDRGQLGNDTRTSSSVPVRENSMKSWKRVSAGSSHTCGIRTDGALWCWGAGAAGQLGDGRAQTDNTIPVQENSASEWTTVVTGASHTCGLKTDRSLWCWGSNGSGQLGTGSVSTSQPEQEQLKALWGP